MRLWPFTRRVEHRREDPSWAALAADMGMLPTPLSPENVAAGCAAISLIASTIGSLPLRCYRPIRGGREEVTDHPVPELFAGRVNEAGSGADLVEAVVSSALLQGNGLALPNWDGNGLLTAVDFVPWAGANAQMLRSGKLYFDISLPTFGAAPASQRVARADVVLLRDRTDNGLLGRPRLRRAAAAVMAAIYAQQSALGVYRSGLLPSALVSLPTTISTDTLERVQHALTSLSGSVGNFGKVVTVPQGMDMKLLSITPENAELQDARRLGAADIARLYGVPPSLLGLDQAGTSFNNSKEQAKWFATFTLAPWCRKLECELTACLLDGDPGHRLEFDMSMLTRADDLPRWQAHQIALQTGTLLPNEVRQVEGWAPRPGGDEPLPAQMPGAPRPTETAS